MIIPDEEFDEGSSLDSDIDEFREIFLMVFLLSDFSSQCGGKLLARWVDFGP